MEDHVAAAGTGATVAGTLHRIEPGFARAEVEKAGFVFDGASTILANPTDPHTATVFDPSIRGHTDQFLFRFRKPR
jgi:predicted methyltransferase